MTFQSTSEELYNKAENNEESEADEGGSQTILDQWEKTNSKNGQTETEQTKRNSCYVVSVINRGENHTQGKLNEILGLVETLGDAVSGHKVYTLQKPNPKTLLGSGVLANIAAEATELGADLLVFDAPLSPSQMRNIENITGFSISDREGVILNVFMHHAKTRSARIQIELAQLAYLRPRIRGLGMNMDQQAGGIGAGKGPGETASELLARRIDKRLVQLQKSAKKLEVSGVNQRSTRSNCKSIALVGYTNAGKTSLMNALTNAGLSARNAPFETLDTTTRMLCRQPGMDVLLSDTVGFIRNLPESLLASFETTMAQVVEADLLLITVDVSDPDHPLHLATTQTVLAKLGANKLPMLYVFNKVDLAGDEITQEYCRELCQGGEHLILSCLDTELVGQLRNTLIKHVSADHKVVKVFVPHHAGQLLAKVHAQTRVIESTSSDKGTIFTLEGEAGVLSAIKAISKEVNEDKS
jgi:GTP-binding protein HflX